MANFIQPRCLGLIPARSGSKRIPNKNIKLLNGHPLLAYTIRAAINSGVLSRVIVSTDNRKIADIALKYGAEVPFLRPAEYATSESPDIEWIKHLLTELRKKGEAAEYFSILRPTSPFRQPETIQRAWKQFLNDSKVDSLRAVEKCGQHPAKMWYVKDNRMTPILKNPNKSQTPWHSTPYQALPVIYVQNASLEISKYKIPLEEGSIAGNKIMPFFTEGYEGFDINNEKDWILAEYLVKVNPKILPIVRKQYGKKITKNIN